MVNSKLLFPLQRDIGISYCRLLLHDTMIKYDSHRSGTSDSPICDCGLEKETSEHYLLCCSMYKSVRDIIFRQLAQIHIKNNKSLQITESLLLAPPCENINNSQNRIIKELLFQFLSNSKRSLWIRTICLHHDGTAYQPTSKKHHPFWPSDGV